MNQIRPPSPAVAWPAHNANPPTSHERGGLIRDRIHQVLLNRSVWIDALKFQVVVMRNAVGSIACAWFPTACYALGNIFSGKSYMKQSRSDLIVANSMWAGIAYGSVAVMVFLPLLLSSRFIVQPDKRPSIWFCLRRLIRATYRNFFAIMAIMFASSYFAAYLSVVKPSMFKYKIECYVDAVSLSVYFTGLTSAVYKIYYRETCQGRDRLASKRPRKSKIIPQTVAATIKARPASASQSPRRKAPPLWQSFAKNLPTIIPTLLAPVFVHIISVLRIVDRGQLYLAGLVLGGFTLKFAIQEFAKYYIFKHHIKSARAMCVLIGVPTVLIDTQTRVILLGNSNSSASKGTIVMAFVGIGLRAGKALMLMKNIRHRERQIQAANTSKDRRTSSFLLLMKRHKPSISREDFQAWKRQFHVFHTAEINANMYAEYIAIGCSTAILFFYGNHPLYSLLRQSQKMDTQVDMVAWRLSQLYMLGFQMGVEVLVDYVAVVLEMTIGIEFEHVKPLGSFLAYLFMFTAVINITISVGIYLS